MAPEGRETQHLCNLFGKLRQTLLTGSSLSQVVAAHLSDLLATPADVQKEEQHVSVICRLCLHRADAIIG